MTGARQWAATATAALVVVAIIVGIFLVVQGGQPEAQPRPANPTALPTNSRVEGPVQAKDVTLPVYFLGDTAHGTRLYREFRRYQGVVGWSDLRLAVNSALIGDATDPDYRTGFPRGTSANVSVGADAVTVHLSGDVDLTRAAGADGALALQAVVYTVQAVLQRRLPVRFLVDGRQVDQVLGADARQPVARADSADVQAPVWIVDPGNETTVSSPFTVTGVASAFEATVQWELKDGARVVRRGFATAKECCTPSPYSFAVRAPSGTYTLVVHDSDESGNGGAVNQDTKEITVR